MMLARTFARGAAKITAATVIAALLGCSTASGPGAPGVVAVSATPGRVAGLRRLTEAQYRNVVADVFGDDVKIGGRFEPIARPDHGLIAVGAAQSAVSPAGFEQFDVMARGVADQVLDPRRRASVMPCKPVDPSKPDPACARAFFGRIGLYVFRRPLTAGELETYVALAGRGAEPTHDFYQGLKLGLGAMLVSPEFLYRIETVGADNRTLDAYTKATRLSFLLWDSTPDQPLLAAAAHGDLDRPQGLSAQVDRMLASPRAEQGVRAFFTDFLQIDRVPDLSKDTVVYPSFDAQVAQDLGEQTLRTVVDLLVTQKRPYPELFTSRKTFLNRRLGLLYGAPVSRADGWVAYEFPVEDDRAGILGQGAFLALFSHEGRSSPTLRGRAIREVLLCQPVPNPPANVDFSGFNDTSNAVLRTARQRLQRHATDPACAACHKITDPLGLPLERFDGVGAARDQENGAPIDVSGSFERKSFDGAAALGYLMAQSHGPTECVTQRLAAYASGVGEDDLPKGWSDGLGKTFAASGYSFPALMRAVALSPQFFAAGELKPPATRVAQLIPFDHKNLESRR